MSDADRPEITPARSSLARFREFDRENPAVYDLFVRFALMATDAGRVRFSARTIMERVRWYTHVETRSEDGLKINDHWAPYYVRKFIGDYPQHVGLFELRKAIADDKDADGRLAQ